MVKVKYGEKNGEVYAEVAGSRLLWALGFQADVMYPARVTCRNCPPDPFLASGADWKRGSPAGGAERIYDPAVIERASGSSIEVPGYEGWAWPELDKLGKTPGGATRAQLDALKLLAVFLGLVVCVMGFFGLWLALSAQHARDDAQAAVKHGTTAAPATAAHDHSQHAVAGAGDEAELVLVEDTHWGISSRWTPPR